MGSRNVHNISDDTLIENIPHNVKDDFIHRSSHAEIISITTINGEELDIDDCIRLWEKQALTIKRISQFILDQDSKNLIEKMYDEEGKRSKKNADVLGNDLRLYLDDVYGHDLLTDGKLKNDYANVSKLQRLIRCSSLLTLA